MKKWLALSGMAASLAGVIWYAPLVDRAAVPVCRADARPMAADTERSFQEALKLASEGRKVESLLLLERKASEAGPQKGAALFLLGESAYSEKAYQTALDRYVEAVKADPSLTDRDAPFSAGKTMLARGNELKSGALSENIKESREVAKLDYLLRRLTGGCK